MNLDLEVTNPASEVTNLASNVMNLSPDATILCLKVTNVSTRATFFYLLGDLLLPLWKDLLPQRNIYAGVFLFSKITQNVMD